MSTHMPERSDLPQSMMELLEVEDEVCEHDTRPWNEVTETSRACWAERGTGIEVECSKLMPSAYVLRSSSVINFGLPVLESRSNPVRRRTMAGRLELSEQRHLDRNERPKRRSEALAEPYCPEGVPTGIHPKSVTSSGA